MHDRLNATAEPRSVWQRRKAGGVAALLALAVSCLWAAPVRAETAALVLDGDTGAILYSYRVDELHHPASLTKIMTVYLAFEALRDGRLKRGQKLKVSRSATWQKPSRLGLRRGSRIRIEDAILALLTKSANDVAVVVAEAISGSEKAFAKRMTERAKELGMWQTVFRNASGLHHSEQVTTARDMATLAQALLRDFPKQYHLFSTKRFTWRGRRYKNHNDMLSSYEGADGIKTGYIRQSGFNLVASAQREKRRITGVVLGGRNTRVRNWAMETLLDYGFDRLGDGNATTGFPGLPYSDGPAGADILDLALGTADSAIPDDGWSRAPWRGQTLIKSPSRNGTRSSSGSAKWSIQVGAYLDVPGAEDAAARAVDRIPALLAKAVVAVTTVTRDGRRLYRARLTGLSEDRARNSCRQLAEHRIPCLAIADTGEFRTSSLVR